MGYIEYNKYILVFFIFIRGGVIMNISDLSILISLRIATISLIILILTLISYIIPPLKMINNYYLLLIIIILSIIISFLFIDIDINLYIKYEIG